MFRSQKRSYNGDDLQMKNPIAEMILEVTDIIQFLFFSSFFFIFNEATFTPVVAMLRSELSSVGLDMFFKSVCVCVSMGGRL